MTATKLKKYFKSNGKRSNCKTGKSLGTECKTRINRNKKMKAKGHLEMYNTRLIATNCLSVTMVFRNLKFKVCKVRASSNNSNKSTNQKQQSLQFIT